MHCKNLKDNGEKLECRSRSGLFRNAHLIDIDQGWRTLFLWSQHILPDIIILAIKWALTVEFDHFFGLINMRGEEKSQQNCSHWWRDSISNDLAKRCKLLDGTELEIVRKSLNACSLMRRNHATLRWVHKTSLTHRPEPACDGLRGKMQVQTPIHRNIWMLFVSVTRRPQMIRKIKAVRIK